MQGGGGLVERQGVGERGGGGGEGRGGRGGKGDGEGDGRRSRAVAVLQLLRQVVLLRGARGRGADHLWVGGGGGGGNQPRHR